RADRADPAFGIVDVVQSHAAPFVSARDSACDRYETFVDVRACRVRHSPGRFDDGIRDVALDRVKSRLLFVVSATICAMVANAFLALGRTIGSRDEVVVMRGELSAASDDDPGEPAFLVPASTAQIDVTLRTAASAAQFMEFGVRSPSGIRGWTPLGV